MRHTFLGTVLSAFADTPADLSFYPVLSLLTRVTTRSTTMGTMKNAGDFAAAAEPDTDMVRVIVRSIVCGSDTMTRPNFALMSAKHEFKDVCGRPTHE